MCTNKLTSHVMLQSLFQYYNDRNAFTYGEIKGTFHEKTSNSQGIIALVDYGTLFQE